MLKNVVLLFAVVIFSGAPPALAQAPRVEVSATVGWVFSDGVEGDAAIVARDGEIYDRVDPKDSFGWGLGLGVMVTEGVEVGFMFNQQPTQLEIEGTAKREIGDLSINTYHGYFAYNFGLPDAPVRPYVLLGLGASNFGSVEFTTPGGDAREIQSSTEFSGTLGAGVKFFGSPNVGGRVGARWTPTYIKTDSAGWWCDPFWGCYLVGDAQYANQFELSGGIIFRF
jgi:opacity protein-like surface antigen